MTRPDLSVEALAQIREAQPRWRDNEPVQVSCFYYCPITEALHALPLMVDVRWCDSMRTKWRMLPLETPQPHVALANVSFWCPPPITCLTQMQGSVLSGYDLDNVIICYFYARYYFSSGVLRVALCPTLDHETRTQNSRDPSKKIKIREK
jgi:hypothetical protein